MTVTSILLIRHGQSTWNQEHRWQGQADPPLANTGRKQAFAAAGSVGSVDAVVASPQQRALETAVIISDQIGVGPVITVDDLKERDSGDWSGKTRDEIYSQWPDWEETGYRPNGWEPDAGFLKRIYSGLNSVVQEFSGGTVLIISHSGVIMTLERDLGCYEGRIPNLAGRLIKHSGSEFTTEKRMLLIPENISTGGENSTGQTDPL